MFLGQGHRSKVKVTRSKGFMGIEMECLLENQLSYITVRNTMMWGVYKAHAF